MLLKVDMLAAEKKLIKMQRADVRKLLEIRFQNLNLKRIR